MDIIDREQKRREKTQIARASRRKEREAKGIKLPLKPRNWKAKKHKRRKMARASRKRNR